MKIYRVRSKWSNELVRAKNIVEAAAKYDKVNKKISPEDREIEEIELLGDLVA